MRGKPGIAITLFLSLNIVASGFAATIIASGAGPLPGSAQDLTGLFPSEIVGTLEFPNGVNMFKIQLNAVAFSARTVLPAAHGVPDPELFLFDSTGAGVYFNDDVTAIDTQSCLPSGDPKNPCPSVRPTGVGPTLNGTYYLAITRSANMALDSISNALFTNLLTTDVVGPDMPGDVIAGWDNNVNTSPNFDQVNYDIFLTGTVPEPATWLLTGLGLAVVLLHRKRIAR